ncbi:hypothetical protein COCOBI_05-6010 [Coccomyxa sp. Obi]|nr:hypothetical protein COCOBI_05-6010 [Coccomyxa sp. Obi]
MEDGEGDADVVDDGSCNEGDLDCESRDVGLGENPFASPSSSRVMAAEQHHVSTTMAPPRHLSGPDPLPEQRFFQESRLHDALRSAQILEPQMNMGSPNPAQLHRRPYTPEKYSPQGGRRIFYPNAGPQQTLEPQSDWAAGARTMWDSQFEAHDTYAQMRRSSGSGSGAPRHTLGSEPPQLNGHAALQPAQEGRPVSRHLEWPPDHMQKMYYDGRPSQGFLEEHSTFAQPDTGPYATQHDQPTIASQRMYSSHAASLRESFSHQQQQQMMDPMAQVPYPQRASLATGVPVHDLGATAARQAAAVCEWSGGNLLHAEELQQELANAQAAERAYLGTITSLSARLEAAIGREGALRQRLLRAEAAASIAGPRQPSTMVSSQSEPQTPTEHRSAAVPEQVTGSTEPEQADGAVAEPQAASNASSAGRESAQREEKSPVRSSKDRDEKVDMERAEIAALQDSLAAANEKCRNLQQDLSLANKRLESTAAESRQADVQVAHLRTANTQLEASLERAKGEISQLLDQLREDARGMKAAERQRQAAELEAVSLRQALDAAKRGVATKDQEIARLQQNLHSAHSELADLQRRYRQLERSSLMSQPVMPPAGKRTDSHDGASPLPTFRREGTPYQTGQASPRRPSDAPLRGSIETAIRGFTRGPPPSLVFQHDAMPRLTAQQNGSQRTSAPKVQNGQHSADSPPLAAPHTKDQMKLPASEGLWAMGEDDYRRRAESSVPNPEGIRNEGHDGWDAAASASHNRQVMQLQAGAQNGRVPLEQRPAEALASGVHSSVCQIAGEQQQLHARYNEEEPLADMASSVCEDDSAAEHSPSWGHIQDKEGRSENSAAGARGYTYSSSGAADDAGHLMQNGAAKGALSYSKHASDTGGSFRPYATDLSLQDFMTHQKALEDRLMSLNEESKQLEAEFARMPADTAGRTLADRRRRAEVEDTLAANKRECSHIRLQLRRLGLK